MINKITKEDEKLLEEQITKEIKENIEIMQPIISRYVAFKINSNFIHKITAQALGDLEGRLRIVERILNIPEVEE